METAREETKQEIVDDICRILNIGPFELGAGSTEPAAFFHSVAESLNLDMAGALTKPEMGQRIVEHAGLDWDESCDSRGTNSRGGSTVTAAGLDRLRLAVRRSIELAPAIAQSPLDIRPGIESLLTYRHHGYDIWYAIAELVDNAVSSYRVGTRAGSLISEVPLKVEVDFDKESRSIVVNDNAGGIELDRLQDALIAGRAPMDKSELNQFGMGLKTASFWFGSHLRIETFPTGSKIRIEVDVDLFKMVRTGAEVVPQVSPSAGEVHGTRIRISNLWPEREIPAPRTLKKVRDYLSSIYRDDIKAGNLVLEVGGQRLAAPIHEVLEAPRWDQPGGLSVRWEKLIEVNFDGVMVEGVVWLLSRGDTANAGLVLTWKGKAIVGAGAGANDANDSFRPTTIYGRSNSFLSQRLMGELDMSAFPVTAKKDGLEWTEDDQEKFAGLLRTAIDAEPLPMLKMASMYRKRPKKVDVKKDIDSAAASLVAALENLDIEVSPTVDFRDLPDEEVESQPSRSKTLAPAEEDESDGVPSQVFALPMLFPGMRAGELRIEWDPEDSRVVWWNREDSDLLVIHVNRASRYIENYSALPEFRLEPILRILAALVMAEIQATSEGLRSARRVTAIVNERLGQSLGLPSLAGHE